MSKIIVFLIFAVLIPVLSNLFPRFLKPLNKVHRGMWPSAPVVIWTAISGMTSALVHLFFQEMKHSFR